MGKYKEVREVIVNSLSDKQWHGVDTLFVKKIHYFRGTIGLCLEKSIINQITDSN